ncbi:Sucrose symporter plant [Penicillium cf. viridicatum]|uniref:Sucrose symporter plant n=1 Tax=Penicillium cf. viridicatum TaxID=2972119 RepID=A0A9W9T406_9EURO|nr:Sucrose symporter plant [Penicillium cf. viridicatum]
MSILVKDVRQLNMSGIEKHPHAEENMVNDEEAHNFYPMGTKLILISDHTLFLFELSSLIFGVASNSTTLTVGRVVAGLNGRA